MHLMVAFLSVTPTRVGHLLLTEKEDLPQADKAPGLPSVSIMILSKELSLGTSLQTPMFSFAQLKGWLVRK